MRSTTRRHITPVSSNCAAVVLGVLGYPPHELASRAPAAELHRRARAWLARHDPHTIPDPASAPPITWVPHPDAIRTYAGNPPAFRRSFAAFTTTSRDPASEDWVSWEPEHGPVLTHQALPYGSAEEFLAGTVPFIREGLQCGDQIWIMSTVRDAGVLRVALGADARRVVFGDCRRWFRHPVRALAALHRAVRLVDGGGQRLRMIGEPLWAARPGLEGTAWIRYESLVNVALAAANTALLCTYDTRVVAPELVTQVARTHPNSIIHGNPRRCPGYVDPAVFNAELDTSPLPEPPHSAQQLTFDRLSQLATVRRFMTTYATSAGAIAQSVAQFVQAVDEVAINAIEHGGGSGLARVWTAPHTILCEIRDTGAGLRDPLAGYLPPPPGRADLRGLWMARQFCDLVEVRTDPAGTNVRLHLALPRQPSSTGAVSPS
ncbi:MAG: anti-sigma factor RsbA family regulatory protein [Pseudonocardiaceae bacterium]